jgi:protease I
MSLMGVGWLSGNGVEVMTALILVADDFEDLTLFLPWYRLREEGVEVRLASPRMHVLTGEHGYRVEPDTTIHEVNPADYDLLLLPDGACGERLRIREEAVDVARTFMQEGMRVAAIGHGTQLLISAGSLDGRQVTCSPGIRDDVRAAGALYRDEAVVLDGNLLTGRGPDDLPAFAQALRHMLRAKV